MRMGSRLLAVLLVSGAVAVLAVAAGAQEAAPGSAGQEPGTLSLEQAIRTALVNNPQVGVAEQGIWARRGQLTQAQGLLMPRLDLATRRVTPVDLPAFSFQSSDTTLETELSASVPLYTAGSLQQGAAAARSLLRASEGVYERARQQIAFAVRQTYYGVLTAEEAVKVAQDVLNSAQEHLRVARLRYEEGVAPQYDVLAAEARVARVEQELISARSARDIAWASLGAVMGAPVPSGTKLTTPRPVETIEATLEALSQEARANRPDLRVGQSQVAAARAQLAVVRAARYPTVAAAASYTLRQKASIPGTELGLPEGTELVISQSSGYLVLSATWALFNGGQVFGQIRTAEAGVRQAERSLRDLELSVGLEVERAYYSLRAAQAQLLAARKEVEQAAEAHRVAKLRYQEGVGTSVEILDAEANLEGARTRLNQAIYGLNLAVAQVDLAVGRAPLPEAAALEEAGAGG